jgi:hypothetical protein
MFFLYFPGVADNLQGEIQRLPVEAFDILKFIYLTDFRQNSIPCFTKFSIQNRQVSQLPPPEAVA